MKRTLAAAFLAASLFLLTGCMGSNCSNCGTAIGAKDRMYDPIADKYVCLDCYYSNAWDVLDELMYVDAIEDYLDAHGYKIVRK